MTNAKRRSPHAPSIRQRLLIGVSLGSLMLAGVAAAQTRGFGNRGGGSPVDNAIRQAQQQAASQAQTSSASQRAVNSFRRAAATRKAMSDAQAAARAAAKAAQSTVPNGLGQGGLQVAGGVPRDPSLWIGANGPTQATGTDGRTVVTIGQTESKAILTWDSFNVGRETDLVFNQKGNTDWVALNRVSAGTDPTKILGTIKADGSVYIINRNGIIFGGASQVNTRNLIASTANIANDQFLNRGIYSSLSGPSYVPVFTGAGGAVTVEAGAQITTHTPKSVTAGGGFVLLMGTAVTNAGSITTPRGQTALVAGDDFILRRGFGTNEGQSSTTRGNEVRGFITSASTTGAVSNIGQIEASEGDITLGGRTIRQDGVLVSTTSVNQRGSIHLLNSAADTKGSVTLGKDSLTLILPELDSNATALNSQRDALAKPAAQTVDVTLGGFDDRSTLSDRLDQSRVEIVTGGTVRFEGGSQTMAQGGQVAVQASRGRITVADGASIDVSGVRGVSLDMGSNAIKVNVQGNELRDSPGNREDSRIKSQNVWIDVRDLVLLPDGTGGYAGDRWYTPGGLLEVGGYLANTAHGIGEWTAVGGTITLSGNEVIAQKGAQFDISGGSLDYRSGLIRSTRVMGADGRMYDIRNAPAGMKMVAVGNAFMAKHDRWGSQYTEVYSHPFFSRGTSTRWEEGYTVGRDAGRLILSTPTAIMEGDIHAEVINGDRQTRARADGVTDGYALGQHTVAKAGTLVLGRFGLLGPALYNTDVRIGDVANVTGDLAAGAALPVDRTNTAWFDARHLNAQGLGGIELGTRGTIRIERDLVLADAGEVKLFAPVIDIAANVTARGGSVLASNFFRGGPDQGGSDTLIKNGGSTITLRKGATLDLRGLWVNTALNAADANKLGLIDGGSVRFESTHDVTLEKGSLIDVSSGGAMLGQGATRGGRGGDVTLIADMDSSVVTADGLLRLDGDIRAYGVAGGGTLKLESGTAVVIGGKAVKTDGVLGAGEQALVDLVLMEDYQVKVGDILPVDYNYTRTRVLPGEAIGGNIFINGSRLYPRVTLAADWTPPRPVSGRYSMRVRQPGQASAGFYAVESDAGSPVPTFRAGSIIESLGTNSFDAPMPPGYVLPRDAFPNGVTVLPQPATLPRGAVALFDFTISSGTRVQAGAAFGKALAVKPTLSIDPALFQTGFSSYDVAGRHGLVVGKDTTLDVTMPVYRVTAAASTIATGANPRDALELWTPPTYQADPVAGQLTQRAGASLTLGSTLNGPLTVSAGARITVDPGQRMSLSGRDTVAINGTLNAWGGTIALRGDYRDVAHPGLVWIGETAVLDAAARAVTAIDQQGRRYGLVADGGTISIGGGLDWEETGQAAAPDAFVVIRPGALLDASGTRAILDIPGGGGNMASTPVAVASDGGSIIIKSSIGLHLDGSLRAAAGGDGAAGGTLALALESPNYETYLATSYILRHREFILAQQQGDSLIPATATALDVRGNLTVGATRVGVDRIAAGGFDNLSLLVDGPLSFDGNVRLDMRQSLRLYAGAYALSEGASATTKVSLSASYVRLAGVTRYKLDNHLLPFVGWRSGPSQQESNAVFSITADMVDIRDRVGFGARGDVNILSSTYTVDRRGFALVDLTSRGDLRILGGTAGLGLSGATTTELATPGDINLTAAQIYPGTGAGGYITAGYTVEGGLAAGSVLNIRRYGNGEAAMPYSVFGSLIFSAETINQGGVVRAPLGQIRFGGVRQFAYPDVVNLLAGSLTSVSGAGLVIPYGGTVDGLSYFYNGAKVKLNGVGDPLAAVISFQASHVNAEKGSTLDLSGGGELLGAGFITGRGGSVDILKTPLANAGPGYKFSSADSAVYAIVPSSTVGYAPVTPEAGYGAPGIGRQITIPAGVPGLPAGTYTLMPSTYALLPGAFRVEIGKGDRIGLSGVSALGNGSYVAAGHLGIANTTIRDVLPSQVVITPGAIVRTHSGYNEMGYNAFVMADAARIGVPRALLTSDAKTLDLNFYLAKPDAADHRPVLTLDGAVRLNAEAKSNGYGGVVLARGVSEVLAPGQVATEGLAGVSISADALNALNAPRLVLNGSFASAYGQSGRFVSFDAMGDGDFVLRSGASLKAAEVVLVGNDITIEEGASIDTIGHGATSFDSSNGYVFTGNGVLAVSNGWFNLILSQPAGESSIVPKINIGACVTLACDGTTRLLSEGTIAVASRGALTIADNVSYGTKNLVLGLSAVNLGENASLAAAAAAGRLPDGLALNQSRLAELLAGNTATGAPKLETLVLNARDAVNIFGSVSLDTINPATGISSLGRLVLGTPAIYGYGAAGDVASIRTGEFIWTGAPGAPGAAMAGMLGDGTLDIAAKSILFGYGPNTQPSSTAVDDRLTLGFSRVNLTASERITSSGKGSLSVYHRQGDYVTGKGYSHTGGDLAITTALMTGEAGSVNRIAAGGAVTVTAPAGATTPATSNALGATLELSGRSISVDTAVVLPSGRLALTAVDDIVLGSRARLDLSGREVTMFDVKKYSWGGDLLLTSTGGDITQTAGSVIDLSAKNNRGGTLTLTALGAGAGHVALAGRVLGAATGNYDAGGTFVPYDAAEIIVRAQTLADFSGLNGRLTEGGVFGARRFQIKQGDLTVGDEVKAHAVEIVLDGGDLTINGKIDASGAQVGSIRLAAMGDLTINGTLDAHGTGLRLDSYGKIIDSPNRAAVELTTREGRLTLADSARVDLRAGTESTRGDGKARGTLDLIAPRIGANDLAVDVLGTLDVVGAKTVAVYGLRSYDDAPLALLPDVTGHRPQIITQALLDGIDMDSQVYINAALGNAALGARLTGLGAYHLRPGVEIIGKVSADNPNGDLTVSGDLDLSGYRYGPGADRNNPARRGFGEPGMLQIRAAGDVNIHGSINDGFAPPPETPDDKGWRLTESNIGDPFGGDIVVPIDGVVLDVGTSFPPGTTLNYDVPVDAMTLPAGTVLPVDVVLMGDVNLSAGTVVAANIYNADGSLAYAAGSVMKSAVTLGAGMKLGAGTPLRAATSIAALTWPKGVALPVGMSITSPVTLAQGSLIPAMTHVELLGNQPVDLRPIVNGVQGRNWAVAPMLGDGATSWNLTLTAGADLASADRRALNPASSGSVKLADAHYILGFTTETIGGGTAYWAEGNFFEYPANTLVSPEDLMWCDIDPGQCVIKNDYVWTDKNSLGRPAGSAIAEKDLFWCDSNPEFCKVVEARVIVTGSAPAAPAFSVIRTGAADLDVIAAGDIRMDSLYGIYTAGAATSVDAVFDRPRGMGGNGTPLGNQPVDYAPALATYHAWYPDQGGNVLISAGRNLIGDVKGTPGNGIAGMTAVGNWLWRQGSGTAALDEMIPTAWWINFGSYVPFKEPSGAIHPQLAGFTGIGALGGGDVTIRVGGDAGAIDFRGYQGAMNGPAARSQALVVAVGGTGRVTAGGALTLTGGGDIDMRIAGALNPIGDLNGTQHERHSINGTVTNLRGATRIGAASMGVVKAQYTGVIGVGEIDPRVVDPFERVYADARAGLVLVPGDSAVYLETLGDLVLGGVGDPGRGRTPNLSGFSSGGTVYDRGGQSWFSLWTDHTAINLVSAGGDMVPGTGGDEPNLDGGASDIADTLPSILRVAALSGDLYFGTSARVNSIPGSTFDTLRPSAAAELEILAAGSIHAGQRTPFEPYVGRHTIALSGSAIALPTPFNPAFFGSIDGGPELVSNLSPESLPGSYASLFAFGRNTAENGLDRPLDAPPIRLYALRGDIVGLGTGRRILLGDLLTLYEASAPVWMKAGRDIVSVGTPPGEVAYGVSGANYRTNLIVHNNATDVSIVQAGRDILYANFEIAGPGTLEVSAGRNILQEGRGSFISIGPVAIGDTRPGAGISLMAGMGANGPNFSAIRTRYLDPANLADPKRPLADQDGKVAKTYEKELAGWLDGRYGFKGTTTEALAYFDALAPEQQRVFLRDVYYAELREGGREYNEPDSSRFASYLRGREMIGTLFPDKDKDGKDIVRTGDIIMFGGSGVRTSFGGDIQMMAPGGQIVVGVQGVVPPASSGLITQGQGNIQLFSEKSLLLGLSRIMTTFGGSIFAWSEQGDINAGRGSKTSILFTPPRRTSDRYGNVALAPQVPSSGAGIATLNPIPEVAPGDIDLIAPLGTIDAGEAGIRVSGNINLAALQVLNAANIEVQGNAKGIPLPPVVNTGALSAASAATSSVVAEATRLAERARPPIRTDVPIIFTVRLLGFGE
ncbi:MAG: filamentous hemagglutinin family protein [Pseudomonadota bacterium]|uniref:filamentous haemagglutinin family protein n=1 Tax=Sphingomonas sp. ERG5 TaxID=1381597 RepID=UPI000690E33C|nr:filamentous haemagglutinin family protein [Sphingomonas sp. ERG5]